MATDLKVYEPIEMPFQKNGKLKHIDKAEKDELLSRLEHAGLSDKQGCYIFGLGAGGGFRPWYVGKATKSMRQECISDHSLKHYNAVLFKGIKGTPVMFIVAPGGNKCKVPEKTCDDIETFLIQSAYYENPELRNTQKTNVPEWSIDGVIRGGKGKPTDAEQSFKKMMGL